MAGCFLGSKRGFKVTLSMGSQHPRHGEKRKKSRKDKGDYSGEGTRENKRMSNGNSYMGGRVSSFWH